MPVLDDQSHRNVSGTMLWLDVRCARVSSFPPFLPSVLITRSAWYFLLSILMAGPCASSPPAFAHLPGTCRRHFSSLVMSSHHLFWPASPLWQFNCHVSLPQTGTGRRGDSLYQSSPRAVGLFPPILCVHRDSSPTSTVGACRAFYGGLLLPSVPPTLTSQLFHPFFWNITLVGLHCLYIFALPVPQGSM